MDKVEVIAMHVAARWFVSIHKFATISREGSFKKLLFYFIEKRNANQELNRS